VSIIQSHDSRHNGDVDEAEVQRESADNENTTTRQNEKTNQKALKKTRRRPIVIVEDNINRQMKDCVRKIIEKSEIGGIKKTSVEKSTYETTSSSEQQSKRNEKRPNNADAVARLEQPNNNTALSPAVTDSLMAAPAPAADVNAGEQRRWTDGIQISCHSCSRVAERQRTMDLHSRRKRKQYWTWFKSNGWRFVSRRIQSVTASSECRAQRRTSSEFLQIGYWSDYTTCVNVRFMQANCKQQWVTDDSSDKYEENNSSQKEVQYAWVKTAWFELTNKQIKTSSLRV
jgi:hypothetical protein